MKLADLHKKLEDWDRKGRRVFTTGDLRKLFPQGKYDSFLVQLRKFAAADQPVIKRAARGIYVFNRTSQPTTNLVEEIARTIRRGSHNYVSLECALSEHGWISQIPVGRLTVMTTGRSGEFKTPWGDIEFTHTHQPWSEFFDQLQDVGRPLKIASPDRALRDLRRVGRNTHLVTPEVEEESLDAEF
ncbi:hypothetical protein AB9K35_04390 [Leisingera sp. XS_AS12]|uniref:type IV toxin-antitoxin system AbiEi family antitoxin n=1 Tax=Leisingera TaxID=191028 RepID=UPI00040FE4C8|nr:hypothetical protein [Leisingera caerulea]